MHKRPPHIDVSLHLFLSPSPFPKSKNKQTNKQQQQQQKPRKTKKSKTPGAYPGADWQIGFTKMFPKDGFKYLLVFVDTFTGWIETFPTRTEKATEGSQVLTKGNFT